MNKIITIPGIPISQGRPRLARSGHCFDPNAKQKKQVKDFLKTQWQMKKLDGAHVTFIFCMPIPKAALKKKLDLSIQRKKPDVDNLVKFYLDCLTGIAWEDDSCVSLGGAVKVYSGSPKTIINIEEQAPSLDALLSERPSFFGMGDLLDLKILERSRFESFL